MQKNNVGRLILAAAVGAAASLTSTATMAGTNYGTVTKVSVREGLVYFTLSGAPLGRPGCAANTTYFMVKDENSAVGKQHMAILMTAQVTGRSVWVNGTNACTKWPDGEDLREIALY